MAAKNYYNTLGVPRTATRDEIKTAFRRLVRNFHPDVSEEVDAEARFKEVLEAYEVLADEEKRANYDLHGQTPDGFTYDDFTREEDASDIFGDGWFRKVKTPQPDWRRPYDGPIVGEPMKQGLVVTLEEAMTGTVRSVEVPQITECTICHGSGASPGTGVDVCPVCRGLGQIKQVHGRGYSRYVAPQSCPRCQGTGKVVRQVCEVCHGKGKIYGSRIINVNIPPGVSSGTNLRLAGEGKEGIRGGRRGDLYVMVTVAPHDHFERDGDDLHSKAKISMVQAVLGGNVEVNTLNGRARLTVPPGTQNGSYLRIQGFGMPRIGGSGNGDLLVEVSVIMPDNLTPRQRELLKEFAVERGEAPDQTGPVESKPRKKFKFF
jgi:molecular chaperone DnaJ